MGCGISKIDPDEERSHDLNEVNKRLRKRNHNAYVKVGKTLASEKLLHPDNSDQYDGKDHDRDKENDSLASDHISKKSLTSLFPGKRGGRDAINVTTRPAEAKSEEGRVSDMEEDQREISDREDSILFPGSPSFREYCVRSGSKNEGKNDEREENWSESESLQNQKGPKTQETDNKKGTSKGRGIKAAIHKSFSKGRIVQ